MERHEPSRNDSFFMGLTMDDPSFIGSFGDMDDPSLMGPFDGVGGGLQSQMNGILENGSSSQSVDVHANKGNGESPGDGAARINEVNPSTATKNKKKRTNRHDGPRPEKRSLHRVTKRQLQVLEGFFSVCAHPDDSQRRQLSDSTGLLLHQVKFWFQNRRTHVKHLSGREENHRLKVENEMLKEENNRLRQAQSNAPAPATCPRCSNDPGHLLLEGEVEQLKALNQMLQQQLQLQSMDNDTPMAMDSASGTFQSEPSLQNVFVVQHEEQMLAELAKNAAQELLILADPNCPLWLTVPSGAFEILNMIAYAQTFPGQMSVDSITLKTEATRASAVVMLEPKSLVAFLMEADSYGTMFPGLLSSAAITKVYNPPNRREENYDGTMQMVTVEMVFPSPLVASRKCTFVRYYKKLEQGAFAVVDVSVDDGAKCRKMPSGLLIQPIRYNSCKVTAIDHVRVDDINIHHLFEPCLSGLLFGARRCVTTIARQCARIRDVFYVTNCTLNVTSRGRKNIMKLADNLLANFTSSVAAFPEDAWTVQCGVGTEEDIKIIYKNQDESSSSSGSSNAVVCVTASFMLPLPMRKAFELLKNNLLRAKWDVLVNGGSVKEEVRVANGIGSDDAVSILHVKHGHGARRDTMMILQNLCYEASGSFMVYSSVDRQQMEVLANPGDNQAISNINLFPAGFALVPVTDPEPGLGPHGIAQPGATVMTVGFQILMKLAGGTGLCPRSVSSAAKIMSDNIANIKDALFNSHPIFYQSIQSVN